MPNFNELNEVFDRLLTHTQTAADIEFLQQWLQTSEGQKAAQAASPPAASSKFNTNIGQISGGDVQVGDRTYYGTEAETLRSILQAPQNLIPAAPASTATRKILFLASSPVDQAKLRLDIEMREIANVLRQARHGNQFELVQRWAVSPDDFQEALLDIEPEIVHFSGHGAGEHGIVLEDRNQKTQFVATNAIAQTFHLVNADTELVKCVLLNACYSKVQAEAIHESVGCVMGMDKAIGDTAAINFAKGFYRALGNGRSFENAFGFGCNAIDLQSIPEALTPKIICRNR